MIIDITKYVDFHRLFSLLNHSFNKSEEWTKVVTNDHHEDPIKGYIIKFPHEIGMLYNKPLTAKVTMADALRHKVEHWVLNYERNSHEVNVAEAYKLFREIVG